MNGTRRGFIRFLGAALAGAAVDPEKLVWTPTKRIFIPPPRVGNYFLTRNEMTAKVFEMFEKNYLRPAALMMADHFDRQLIGYSVNIRKPIRFTGASCLPD